MSDELFELLAAAADDALRERDRLIFDLRFGISDGQPRTLEDVGHHIGVTRERIRQLQVRCIRRIKSKGAARIRKGHTEHPCAALLLYVDRTVRPDEDGAFERLCELVWREAIQTQLLVAHLCRTETEFSSQLKARRKRFQSDLLRESKSNRRIERFQQLLDQVAYPASQRLLTTLPWHGRQREVSLDGEGNAGSFYSQKLRREVQFESSIEHAFLLSLDRAPSVAAYQEQPFALPYQIAGQTRMYYPDVSVLFVDGRGAVVEMKRRSAFALHENIVKLSALRTFCTEHGYGLLVTDGRTAIQTLLRREVPPGFKSEITAALHRGPLSWPTYRAIRNRHGAVVDDFVALVLQERLIWTLLPFTLQARPDMTVTEEPLPNE